MNIVAPNALVMAIAAAVVYAAPLSAEPADIDDVSVAENQITDVRFAGANSALFVTDGMVDAQAAKFRAKQVALGVILDWLDNQEN